MQALRPSNNKVCGRRPGSAALVLCRQMKSNLQNRSIYCKDNIDVLQGINSKCVDLIYLDPPFNKKKVFTAPIGSSAEGASFKDYFQEEDLKEEWLKTIQEDRDELYSFLMGIRDYGNKYNFCYLVYMAIRIIECHRILKDTGSLYLHCDPTMSHYLKILLDCVFGEKNFLNEIAWCYRKWTNAAEHFQKNHDVILAYTKEYSKHFFAKLYDSNTPQQAKMERGYDVNVIQGQIKQLIVYNRKKAEAKIASGKYDRIVFRDKKAMVALQDWWEMAIINSQAKERTGYPTQKPLALLERIIQASSKKGDLVLDPFCGCATTCIASEKLGRKWVGIDISIKAYELVQERLKKEVANPEELFDYKKALRFSTDPPKRTDLRQTDIDQKYVYVISNKAYKNEYKVGIAHDIQKRLNSYQTSDPNRGYKLEHKKLTPRYRELEKYIHTELQSRHEWVRADLETIKKTMRDFDKSYLL